MQGRQALLFVRTVEVIFKRRLYHCLRTLAHLDSSVVCSDTGINLCRQFQQGVARDLRAFRATLGIGGMRVLAYCATEDVLDGDITAEFDLSGIYFPGGHAMILCQIHDGRYPADKTG